VCSYALTEFEVVPEWLFQAKAIIIIEPATREDGRKLLALRSDLIKNGFEIWAPCLHQMNCPLLQETKNDWCHDRVHFEKPEAFQKIENLLPIKNDTLTLSYLVAKKKSDIKTDSASSLSTNTVRVIGDFLNEKGKSRQLICRNSKREFLTQLKRKLTPLEFERGDILKISSPIKEIGNELRTDSDLTDIKKIN
jgi:ribosomal protein RSM22 (predicted rRNA methylase)